MISNNQMLNECDDTLVLSQDKTCISCSLIKKMMGPVSNCKCSFFRNLSSNVEVWRLYYILFAIKWEIMLCLRFRDFLMTYVKGYVANMGPERFKNTHWLQI